MLTKLPNNPTEKLKRVSSANTPDGGFLQNKAPMTPIPRMTPIPQREQKPQSSVFLGGQHTLAPMNERNPFQNFTDFKISTHP